MNKILSLLILTLFSAPTFAAWTIWVSLGGGIIGDPAACTSRQKTFVVAKGTDNAIWYRIRTLSTGIWDEWKRIPGSQQFSGSPSIACRAGGVNDFFEAYAVGYDGNLYQSYHAGPNNFTPWTRWFITGVANNRLAIGSGLSSPSLGVGLAFPQLFARGSNNVLYYRPCPTANDNNTCSDNTWIPVSPIINSDPAAIHQSPGRLDLVVQATTGTLMHRFNEGGLWYPYNYIGSGSVIGSPDIVSRYQGSLDLFARASNNTLIQKIWINGIWGTNVNLGSPLNAGISSGPGATIYAKDATNARIFVFVRGYDGALWYRAWAP